MSGARLVYNVRYFHIAKPGEKANKFALTSDAAGGLVNYIATRESVIHNFTPEYEAVKATMVQRMKIDEFIYQEPDIKLTEEYKAYQELESAANATRLITKSAKIIAGIEEAEITESDSPATQKQIERIEQFVEAVPSLKDCMEYLDFKSDPTFQNASDFLGNAFENALGQNVDSETMKMMIQYIASRPGVIKDGHHGLFSAEEHTDLQAYIDEVSHHDGNIWSNVISLRREDADALGYNTQEMWKDTVRAHVDEIAKDANIPLNDFRWCGAMHNTGHHPHIHMMFWSQNPSVNNFLSKEGIEKIKSTFAHEIFRAEFENIYSLQNEVSEELRAKADELINRLDSSMSNLDDNSALVAKFAALGNSLEELQGKHQYKFLPKECKALVDGILDDIGEMPEIKKLLELYEEQTGNIHLMYNNEYQPRQLSQMNSNDNLYALKGMVIRAAEELSRTHEIETVEEIEIPEDIDVPEEAEETVSVEDIAFLNETSEHFSTREHSYSSFETAEDKNHFVGSKSNRTRQKPDFGELYRKAMNAALPDEQRADAAFRVAKHYFYGSGSCEQDYYQAQMWYGISAANGHSEASYNLGKMYVHGTIPEEKNEELGREYVAKAGFGFNSSLLKSNNAEIIYAISDEGQSISEFIDAKNKIRAESAKLFEYEFEPYEGIKAEDNAYQGYLHSRYEYLLGKIYYDGDGYYMHERTEQKHFEQDFKKALELYKLSFVTGYAHAAFNIGKMYSNGKGVVQDLNASREWFIAGAEKGDQFCAYALGSMYQHGSGVKTNIPEAVKYYQMAVDEGNAFAQYALAGIYEQGTAEINTDKQKAHDLYARALRNWEDTPQLVADRELTYRVGRMYEKGLGTEKNAGKALENYRNAADAGHAYAQYKVAEALEEDNPLEAQEYYSKALKQFEETLSEAPEAFLAYKVSSMYAKGHGTEESFDDSFRYAKMAADLGHAYAQYHIANEYASGETVEKDEALAHEYYSKAFKSLTEEYEQQPDEIKAQIIAKLYDKGLGIEQNTDKAFEYYKYAADAGSSYAQYTVAERLEKTDPEKAQEYYSKALEQFKAEFSKKPEALLAYRIANMYNNGLGCTADKVTGFEYMEWSADLGNSWAMYKVANELTSGENVPQDISRAHEYYHAALLKFSEELVKEPDEQKAYTIAKLYEKGLGTPVSPENAFRYYKFAADKGNAYAQYKVGSAFYHGNGVTMNREAAQEYYGKALHQFIASAEKEPNATVEHMIGRMYHYGQGTEKDYAEAQRWYQKSYEHGNEEAQESLRKLESDMHKNHHAPSPAALFQRLLQAMAMRMRNEAMQQQRVRRAQGIDRKEKHQIAEQKRKIGQKQSHDMS